MSGFRVEAIFSLVPSFKCQTPSKAHTCKMINATLLE